VAVGIAPGRAPHLPALVPPCGAKALLSEVAPAAGLERPGLTARNRLDGAKSPSL